VNPGQIHLFDRFGNPATDAVVTVKCVSITDDQQARLRF
jgi:hypothetical protein